MKKTMMALAAAAALAVSALAVPAPAQAQRGVAAGVAAGLIGGAIIGGAIAASPGYGYGPGYAPGYGTARAMSRGPRLLLAAPAFLGRLWLADSQRAGLRLSHRFRFVMNMNVPANAIVAFSGTFRCERCEGRLQKSRFFRPPVANVCVGLAVGRFQ